MDCEICKNKIARSAYVFVKGENDFGICCPSCYYKRQEEQKKCITKKNLKKKLEE